MIFTLPKLRITNQKVGTYIEKYIMPLIMTAAQAGYCTIALCNSYTSVIFCGAGQNSSVKFVTFPRHFIHYNFSQALDSYQAKISHYENPNYKSIRTDVSDGVPSHIDIIKFFTALNYDIIESNDYCIINWSKFRTKPEVVLSIADFFQAVASKVLKKKESLEIKFYQINNGRLICGTAPCKKFLNWAIYPNVLCNQRQTIGYETKVEILPRQTRLLTLKFSEDTAHQIKQNIW